MSTQKNFLSLAKLTPPQLPSVLERTRLFEELDRLCEGHRVIWIHGPPGAGKTTLVASYLQARKIKPFWYQVDEGDADPGTWFHCLSLGMKHVAPRFKKPLPLLSPEYLPGISVFTRRFFEQLYGRFKAPGILVFDNYQDLGESDQIQHLMSVALSVIPEGVMVFMISRQSPPPSMAWLLAEQAIVILDSKALALTVEETEALVTIQQNRNARKKLSPDMEALHAQTQGWVAGVILLLAQEQTDFDEQQCLQHAEVASVVFDYFASEVLQHEPKDRQEFLLKTALFPSMTATMAWELTGYEQASKYLTELVRRQYFTVKHRGAEPVYSYHPLFQMFLLGQANTRWTEKAIQTLRIKTAGILERVGRVEEAMVLLRDAGSYRHISRLIREHAPGTFAQGRYLTVENWIVNLPDEVRTTDPWALYWQGVCQVLKSPDNSVPYFEQAFELFEAAQDRMGRMLALCGIGDAIHYSFNNLSRLDQWLGRLCCLMSDKLQEMPPEVEVRGALGMLLAMNHRGLFSEQIESCVERVERLFETISDPSQKARGITLLWLYYSWRGMSPRLDELLRELENVRQLSNGSKHLDVFFHFLCSIHSFLKGNIRIGLDAYIQGRSLAKEEGLVQWEGILFFHGVAGYLFNKDLWSAEKLIEEMRPRLESLQGTPGWHFNFSVGWVARWKGEFEEALIFIQKSLKIQEGEGILFHEGFVRNMLAQLYLDRKEFSKAQKQLDKIKHLGEHLQSAHLRYMTALLEAQLAFLEGKEAQGQKALQRALILVQNGATPFLHGLLPDVMTYLCTKALEMEIETGQAKVIIKKLGLTPDKRYLIGDSWPWPVKVYTLGRFLLLSEAGAIQFGRKVPKTPLALLKILIARGSQDVSQSEVIDWLWPDADGDAAYRSLKMALSRLRKLLKRDDAILFSGGILSVNSKVCWVDSLNFQHLIDQAEVEAKHGNMTKSLELVERARALYKGELLPHDDAAWVLPARTTFERQVDVLDKRRPKSSDAQTHVMIN